MSLLFPNQQAVLPLLILLLLSRVPLVPCYNIPVIGNLKVPGVAKGLAPPLPPGTPQPLPEYSKGHANNAPGFAPDKHGLSGPFLGNDEDFIEVRNNLTRRQSGGDGYWLSEFGALGISPLAPAGYQFYRNVKDFGAVGDGVTDDTAAINRAAAVFSQTNHNDMRCDGDCGSTTTLTAVVYFPPGTYLVSKPIMQYYYTQFVSNPEARAVIKGSADFEGIALIDTNFYYPDGNGQQWYINQSNFFRQIRNFIFDLTIMAPHNYVNGQEYVPTGIHWQVGQATSISNCHFEMPLSGSEPTTAIGIFMENGSGGSVDSLTFFGGNVGFVAGSQQFTATNLQFTLSLTAIKHLWNWGFVWKNIHVIASYIAIDCTEFSSSARIPQGTGSITVIDSHFDGVPYAITLRESVDEQPSIVLENLLVENSASVVLVSGGATILPGSTAPLYITSWVSGYQTSPTGPSSKFAAYSQQFMQRPGSLIGSSGSYYYRSKPQYQGTTPVVATQLGVQNDGTGDQTDNINSILASNVGSIIFFPAGIYAVQGTIQIPVGSRIIGSGWSTFMAEGDYFSDETSPKVMMRVGEPGDQGIIEITDMLFTVKGATKGCVLMEWNVRESTQGSAAMWDSHFRVGGNAGSDLLLADCPPRSGSVREQCMASAMLLHLTEESSGFFDNVWVWVADHDLDNPANAQGTVDEDGVPNNSAVEIAVYAGRGVLIEGSGPTWFYGGGSEHAQLYQWQILNAKNIFMGHMQTETPYYQSDPPATEPYTIGGGSWPADPTFLDCSESICFKAWALRVLNSTDVFLYGLGFYSFFEKYTLNCTPGEDCQQALIETNYAGNVWLYNIFTKGNHEIVTPRGNAGLLQPVFFDDSTRKGYTSSIAAWLALASLSGRDIGQNVDDPAKDGSGIVYIDPAIYDLGEGETAATVQCYPPCTYVFPAITLPTPSTITFPSYTTNLEVGWNTILTFEQGFSTVTSEVFVTVTHTTVLRPPTTIVTVIPPRGVTITDTSETTTFTLIGSINVPSFVVTNPTRSESESEPPTTRTITPPPWPWPKDEYESDDDDDDDYTLLPFPIVHVDGPPFPPYPKDPNSVSESEKDCTTSTFSSCREYCIATPTSTCTSSCSNVVACTQTTDFPTTVTPAPVAIETRTVESPPDQPGSGEVIVSAQEALNHLSSMGLWPVEGGGGGTHPTSTRAEPELPTLPPDGAPYCFTEHNENGRWGAFNEPTADESIARICSTADELPPSNMFGFAIRNSEGLLLSVTWAQDQTGCQAKSAVPIARDNWCRDTFRAILLSCDPFPGQDGAYGGAFVDNYEYGCVRWWIGRDFFDTSSRVAVPIPSFFGVVDVWLVGDEEAREVSRAIDRLEPELPRLNRVNAQQ